MTDDEMITRTGASWHVSRRIPLPHAHATHALGEALRLGTLSAATAAGVLVDDVHHARPGEARGFMGRLPTGRAVPTIRVEVQVEPWSRDESVLGIRPTRRPPRWRAERYFARALAVLEGLEACLLAGVVLAPEHAAIRRAS